MTKFRELIASQAGNAARKTSQIIGKGSGEQIYGRVVDSLNPRALSQLAKNKRIIVVSSTNGKTTTTHLIANAFKTKYKNVLTNALGANQRAGLIAALSEDVLDKQQDTFAILEVDERSLPGLFEEIKPEYLVLSNLSRDQLDRFGEVSSISKSWREMLKGSKTKVLANSNDPHIVYSIEDISYEDKTFVDLTSRWHNDANTCPCCGELLNWDKNSHFKCQSCPFQTPETRIKHSDDFKNKLAQALAIPGSWNVNNAILAYEICKKFEINETEIFSAWNQMLDISGRNAVFKIDDERTVQLFLAKNPAGWNETLAFISENESESNIFAFNCNIADGKDPSWLYDVDFESSKVDNIIVFGERSTDMILRLEIAGKTCISCEDFEDALAKSAFATHTNIIASYTQFLQLSRMLPKLYETN